MKIKSAGKILSLALAATLIIGTLVYIPATAYASDSVTIDLTDPAPLDGTDGITVSADTITLSGADKTYVITGTGSHVIVIDTDMTVILSGAEITASVWNANGNGISISPNVTLTLLLEGASTLTGRDLGAGIRVPENAELIIDSHISPGSTDGVVTATGGEYGGAGIGGGASSPGSGNIGGTCGTVTILGGTVYANGGFDGGYDNGGGAGIGGGSGGDSPLGLGGIGGAGGGGGSVTILGGTVNANGGVGVSGGAAGIGGGGGALPIGDGGDGGSVIIQGGTVYANGGDNGAGIGGGGGALPGGFGGDGGSVTIQGGIIYAYSGGYGAGIGGGGGIGMINSISGGSGGDISVSGGRLTTGSIGGGRDSSAGGTVQILGGDVTVEGDASDNNATYTDGSNTIYAILFTVSDGTAPLADVSVAGGSATATTNASGKGTLFLPGGTYDITFAKTGYASETLARQSISANGDLGTVTLSESPQNPNPNPNPNPIPLPPATVTSPTIVEVDDPDPGPGTGPEPAAPNLFEDVFMFDWFYDDVAYVCEHGIMAGTSDATFSPNAGVTRGMVVTTLWRMAGEPEPDSDGDFTDLTQDWYKAAVMWAAENGIVNGMGDGLFAPDDGITREQLMTMLYRYMLYADTDYVVNMQYILFNDEDEISEYAKNAIQLLYKLGIVGGVCDGVIDPQSEATRAQLAAMLHRFMEL